MTGLALDRICELPGIESIPREPRQLRKFHRWVEAIVLSRGEAGVPENREEIPSQWEQYVKAEFKTCVRARRQGAVKEENHE